MILLIAFSSVLLKWIFKNVQLHPPMDGRQRHPSISIDLNFMQKNGKNSDLQSQTLIAQYKEVLV